MQILLVLLTLRGQVSVLDGLCWIILSLIPGIGCLVLYHLLLIGIHRLATLVETVNVEIGEVLRRLIEVVVHWTSEISRSGT